MRVYNHLQLILIILLAGVLIVFGYNAFGSIPNSTATTKAAAPIPAFKHIFVIVLENHTYDQVIGNHAAPYLNTLANRYGLATQYYGVAHPSLPNYLALTGGDTFGIARDCNSCFVDQPNLADQIEAQGHSWKAYMESMPSPCFVGDAPPLYRQKHNPFIYYDSIRNDPARCAHIVPFTAFAEDLKANTLPDFSWITPNMCNDGHDCDISAANGWLESWVPAIIGSPAWQDDGALFITFDEGEAGDDGSCCGYAQGGRIVTLVISPLGRPGYQSTASYTHYSLLHTIEAAWHMPALGKANCDCSPTMAEFFTPGPVNSEPKRDSTSKIQIASKGMN